MEFDLKDKTANNIVNYNYNETIFYKNQFEKTIENGGYIQTIYPSKSNTPNIVSDNLFDGEYITKKLYIVKKMHKIKGVDFDGELIIEHASLTNNQMPLFSCFLLNTNNKNTEKSEIDSLINTSSCTLDLNGIISSSHAIYYKTDTENVLIFTEPILVISKFDDFAASSFILNPYSHDYKIVKTNKLIEGFKEGVTDIGNVDIATYCQPIDEEDPSIGISADVMIPADGKVAINKSTTSQITTAINFFAFFILVLFVVIVVPVMYKYFIIDLVLENKYDDPPFTPAGMLNRLSAIDIFICFLLFGFSFSFINFGIVNNQPILTIFGFYVFIFFISSFIVLQYKRTFDIVTFLTSFGFTDLSADSQKNIMNNIHPDLFGLFKDNITQLFIKKVKSNGGTAYKIQFNFIIVALIFGLTYGLLMRYGILNTSGKSILTSIPFYMFFVCVYIAVYIKYAYDVTNRTKSDAQNVTQQHQP